MSITMIIFGGTSLQVRRRIIPAIQKIYNSNLLTDHFQIIATARYALSTAQYRSILSQNLSRDNNNERYLSHIEFLPIDFLKESDIKVLQTLTSIKTSIDTDHFQIFFLATTPAYFGTIVRNMSMHPHFIHKNDLIIMDDSCKQNIKSQELTQQSILQHFSKENIYKTQMTDSHLRQTLSQCFSLSQRM